MPKEKFTEHQLEEDENAAPGSDRERPRRRQPVDPDERKDYQEWREERRDRKRIKPNQRPRREEREQETGF